MIKIIKNNLHATKADEVGGLIGNKWGKVYKGYFDKPKIAESVAKACSEVFEQIPSNKKVEILEIGAGTGTVGEIVNDYLLSQGIKTHLTISDKIQAHVEANQNPNTARIVFDNKEIPITDNSIDLVLARSVTHYEPTKIQEIQVLAEIKRILNKDGFFIDQAPTLSGVVEADLLKRIHNIVNKPMNLQTKEQTENMLKNTFREVIVSKVVPASLSANEKGFIQRYDISPDQASQIVNNIRSLIYSVEEKLRPNVRVTKNGFEWDVPYTIFLCKK